MSTLKYNHILAADSYKHSHPFAYPPNVTGMFSYIEARTGGHDTIVPFGLQIFLERYLSQPITLADINEAEQFLASHGEPFDREAWAHILKTYDGYLPLVIKALPEGTPVKSGNAIVTIECDDPMVFWLSSFIETVLQRAVWYPTTIATMDYALKRRLRQHYINTGADLSMLEFALHDFGARGVTCQEQAEIGGAAHLVNFRGSDTVAGVRCANHYYNIDMAGFSVYATEHSVECSFGKSPEEELVYLRHQLNTALGRGIKIISIVIDGYDVYRCAEQLCTTLKEEIIASGVKVVFRPDSGDMNVTVPRILDLQAAAFGYELNAKKFKKIKYVGVIQGDGVNHTAIDNLLGKLAVHGYAADNVIFGSGGALLQKVDRDTYKFAQKASAVLKDGVWVGIAKDPVTDPGKKSKSGRLMLASYIHEDGAEHVTTISTDDGYSSDYTPLLVTVYDRGMILNPSTMDQVRARCAL